MELKVRESCYRGGVLSQAHFPHKILKISRSTNVGALEMLEWDREVEPQQPFVKADECQKSSSNNSTNLQQVEARKQKSPPTGSRQISISSLACYAE